MRIILVFARAATATSTAASTSASAIATAITSASTMTPSTTTPLIRILNGANNIILLYLPH